MSPNTVGVEYMPSVTQNVVMLYSQVPCNGNNWNVTLSERGVIGSASSDN